MGMTISCFGLVVGGALAEVWCFFLTFTATRADMKPHIIILRFYMWNLFLKTVNRSTCEWKRTRYQSSCGINLDIRQPKRKVFFLLQSLKLCMCFLILLIFRWYCLNMSLQNFSNKITDIKNTPNFPDVGNCGGHTQCSLRLYESDP